MQGLASVFIALSLLLSPLTGDRPAAGSGMSARQNELGAGGGPEVVTIDSGHDGETTMMRSTRDNSDCPYKYPNLNSKDYCECVVGRSDNFVCDYDCSCSFGGALCVSSSCTLSTGAILIIVGVTIVFGGGCATCVGVCLRAARRRRQRKTYTVVNGVAQHHHHHNQHVQHHQQQQLPQNYMYQQYPPQQALPEAKV